MPNKYTYEVVTSKFKERGYKLISKEYINCKEKLQYICLIHQDKGIQEISFDKFIRGQGCTYCSNCHKSTDDEIEIICNNLDFKFVNVYSENGKKYVNFVCNKHINKGIQHKSLADLKSGRGCKYCCGKNKTTEDFISEMNKINQYIIIRGKYKNATSKIKCQCKIDNTVWYATPNKLLLGEGCPICAKIKIGESHKKTEQEFLEELNKINPNIVILNHYTGIYDKIRCQCKKCNFTWETTPTSLLHKHSQCPKETESYNEKKLQNILSNYSINFSIQKRYSDCKDIRPLPFDIFLKNYNILIEYDGEGHYLPIKRGHMTEKDAIKSLKLIKYHDKIKTEYCLNQNIPLIRIPYWEKDNLECFLFEQLNTFGININ